MTDGVVLEQTVLGHALNDQSCFQKFGLDVEWQNFAVPNHKVLAYCLKRMYDNGVTSPDEDTVQLVVAGYPGDDKDYGGAEYIRLLKKSFVNPTDNYDQIVGRLRLQSVKSDIGRVHLEKLMKVINNPMTSATDIQSILDDAVDSLELAKTTDYDFYTADEICDHYVEELIARTEREFFTSGIPTLDEYLSEGFLPGKISILAGFTGMAKSTTVAAMAHRIAVKGIGCGIFSMETQKEGVWDKMVSTLTQIPIVKLKKEIATLTDDEHQRIDNALTDLKKLPLMINDRASMSIAEMRYQIKSAQKRGHNLQVVFIDLFGKLEDVDSGSDLASKIQQKCKYMRVLAQELGVHFILVVQVGRQGFGRSRSGAIKRPTLVDIKNANAYAEEADLVLLLHRNKYYLPDLPDDILEIHIAKQRDGVAGTICYMEMFADRATMMATHKRPHDVGDDNGMQTPEEETGI